MASTLEKAPETGAEEQKQEQMQEQMQEQDVWDIKRTIVLPRAIGGAQKFVMVGVNGRRYQVPRGKQVEVPLPLYERLMIMLEAENQAMLYRESIPNESTPTGVIKRIR